MVILPVSAAVTISFNPVGLDPDNLQIYNSSGALYGIYNTSSQNIVLPNDTSYSILVVPANDNLFGNHPDTWFGNFVNKIQSNAPAIFILLFIVVCLGVVASRRR